MIKFNIDKIILARANEGLTISQLAEKVGINRKTLSSIEKKETEPRPETVGKIAKALGKTVEDFLLN